jgi:hypothetical protein
MKYIPNLLSHIQSNQVNLDDLYHQLITYSMFTKQSDQRSNENKVVVCSDKNVSCTSSIKCMDFTAYSVHHTGNCAVCSGDKSKYDFMFDSGASAHMCKDKEFFVTLKPIEGKWSVGTADGTIHKAQGKGNIIIKTSDPRGYYHHTIIRNVLYVPGLTSNLLSLGVFLQDRFTCYGNQRLISICKEGIPFLVCWPMKNHPMLYSLYGTSTVDIPTAMSISTINKVSYETLHCRLGHPSDIVIKHAVTKTKDCPIIHKTSEHKLCEGCLKGKTPRQPYTGSGPLKCATECFQHIHSDLHSLTLETSSHE